MIIQTFNISDYDEALKLWQTSKGVCQCDRCKFHDSKERLTKFLNRNPDLSFCAFNDEGELIGTVLSGHDGRTGIIYRLTVREDFRKQGAGRKLVEAAVAGLKAEGLDMVKLFVINDNQDGHKFWDKMGFKVNDVATSRIRSIV